MKNNIKIKSLFVNFIIFLLLTFLFTSCECPDKSKHPHYVKNKRIELIERKNIPGEYISIIKIDGHLYITTSRGGIIHSESCTCKK